MEFAIKETSLEDKKIMNQINNEVTKTYPKESTLVSFLTKSQFNYNKTFTKDEMDVLNTKFGITNIMENDLFDNQDFFEGFYSDIIKDVMKCYYVSKGHKTILEELELLEDEKADKIYVKNTLYIFTPEEMRELFRLMTVKK